MAVGESFEGLEALGLSFAADLEYLLDLQRVLGVRGGVRVLDVLLQHAPLLRVPAQHRDFGLQLVIMRVYRVLALVLLLVIGQEVEGKIYFFQIVQHINLGLHEVRIVKQGWRLHSKVMRDQGEKSVACVKELCI